MAKKTKEKVYDVTIAGEYHAATEKGNELRPYEITVAMNQEHKDNGFLSVFKNLVAPRAMKQKYPDYNGSLHTHRLISAVDRDDPNGIPDDPSLMNMAQLFAFIEKNDLPVDADLYKDEDDLKQAVIECLQDEDGFEQAQNKRREVRGESVKLQKSLADLNPDLGVPGAPQTKPSDEKIDPDKVPDKGDVKVPKQPEKDNGTDKVTKIQTTDPNVKKDQKEEDDFEL